MALLSMRLMDVEVLELVVSCLDQFATSFRKPGHAFAQHSTQCNRSLVVEVVA